MDQASDPVDHLSAQAVRAAAGPLTEGGQKLLARVFGGAANEFGAYFRDRATIWRAGRGIYTLERAADMLRSADGHPSDRLPLRHAPDIDDRPPIGEDLDGDVANPPRGQADGARQRI